MVSQRRTFFRKRTWYWLETEKDQQWQQKAHRGSVSSAIWRALLMAVKRFTGFFSDGDWTAEAEVVRRLRNVSPLPALCRAVAMKANSWLLQQAVEEGPWGKEAVELATETRRSWKIYHHVDPTCDRDRNSKPSRDRLNFDQTISKYHKKGPRVCHFTDGV